MAMGSRGRREAENAIGSCRPFKNSTGSFYGTRGSTRNLGWLESHTEARRIRELLSRAVYVVWSYDTPIAFVSETEDGERTAYYVDESHSRTTAHHQSTARIGLGEYETIGSRPRPVRRPRRQPVRPVDRTVVYSQEIHQGFERLADSVRRESEEQDAIDRLNARTAGYADAARREPTAAHVYEAAVQMRGEVEAGLSAWRAEQATLDRELTVPAGSPGYQLGRTEHEQEQTLARLLDSRFADPSWVPDRDRDADAAAELRDAERVAREGAWRP